MSNELITSFRPEVQNKILSNQEKFNPDKNEYIDANEIGVLLAEYGTTNVSELQNAKGVGRKINDWVFPKVDVEPAQGGGYRAIYTDGDEKYIPADSSLAKKPSDFNGNHKFGGYVLGAISTLGAAGAAGTGIFFAFDEIFCGGTLKMANKVLLSSMLLASGLGFLAQKCIHASKNNKEINAQIDMLKKDEATRAQREAEEAQKRQADLEYRERMAAATDGIEENLNNANARSGRLNSNLRKANAQVDSLVSKTTPLDTIS